MKLNLFTNFYRIFLVVLMVLLASLFSPARADDTETFARRSFRPNLILMLDLSASMEMDAYDELYVSSKQYVGPYNPDKTYEVNKTYRGLLELGLPASNYDEYGFPIFWTKDELISTEYEVDGEIYKGRSGKWEDFRQSPPQISGNYLNWLTADRLDVAKVILTGRSADNWYHNQSIIVKYFPIFRLSMMHTDLHEGGDILFSNCYRNSVTSDLEGQCKEMSSIDSLDNILNLIRDVDKDGEYYKGGSTMTPIGEMLYEGYQYFLGAEARYDQDDLDAKNPTPPYYYKDGKKYVSPYQDKNWCRQSFAVMISDGEPWFDGNMQELCLSTSQCQTSNVYSNTEVVLDNVWSEIASNPGVYQDNTNDVLEVNERAANNAFMCSSTIDKAGCDTYDWSCSSTHDCYSCNECSLNHVAQYGNKDWGDESLSITVDNQGTQYSFPQTEDTRERIPPFKLFTIGVLNEDYHQEAKEILEQAAIRGGESYYHSKNAGSLGEALGKILSSVATRTAVSFTAPVFLPQETFSQTSYYIPVFRPHHSGFWRGNLWKIMVTDFETGTSGASEKFMQVTLDAVGDDPPRADVNNSGTGGRLLQKSKDNPRSLYTYNLNGQKIGLQDLNAEQLELDGADATVIDTRRKNLLNHIYGYKFLEGEGVEEDPFERNKYLDANGQKQDDSNWILGDSLHSRPLILEYPGDKHYIAMGANDGMLHVFDGDEGKEVYGFIPGQLVQRLKEMDPLDPIHSGKPTLPGQRVGRHVYYVDAPPTLAHHDVNRNGIIDSTEEAYLMVGFRRGGRCYIILDVHEPPSSSGPVLHKRICGYGPENNEKDFCQSDGSPTGDGMTVCVENLGQTWSTPAVGYNKSAKAVVAVFGGGYDMENYDPNYFSTKDKTKYKEITVPSTVPSGNFIGVFNISTGALIKKWTQTGSMCFPIVADVAAVRPDITDNSLRWYYVGDLGGNVWFLDLDAKNGEGELRQLFAGAVGPENTSVNCQSNNLYQTRPIYQAVDITMETIEGAGLKRIIYFGTGDRSHPYSVTGMQQRFYSIVDMESPEVLDTGDVQELNPGSFCNNTQDGNGKNGWYMDMTFVDEKILSAPIVFNNKVNFSTFRTDPGSAGKELGACDYTLDYFQGTAWFYSLPHRGYTDCEEGEGKALEEGSISKLQNVYDVPVSPDVMLDSQGNMVVYKGELTKGLDVTEETRQLWKDVEKVRSAWSEVHQ